MESSEHNWANISETICPKVLIFGEQASWTLFFQNILTNPIISQISFSMMSHFGTLCETRVVFKICINRVLQRNIQVTSASKYCTFRTAQLLLVGLYLSKLSINARGWLKSSLVCFQTIQDGSNRLWNVYYWAYGKAGIWNRDPETETEPEPELQLRLG